MNWTIPGTTIIAPRSQAEASESQFQSMFLAGGSCLLLVGHLEETEPKLPLPLRVISGAGIITMVELATGLLFNRRYTVWDYRNVPGNYRGQICLPFCLLWIPISALAGKCYLLLHKLFCDV